MELASLASLLSRVTKLESFIYKKNYSYDTTYPVEFSAVHIQEQITFWLGTEWQNYFFLGSKLYLNHAIIQPTNTATLHHYPSGNVWTRGDEDRLYS